MAKANALRKQRDQYLTDRISDASTATLDAVRNSLSNFDIRIRQIHVKDIDLVDRCESCHLGTREPVTLTAAAMGGDEVFASHPNKELLKIHDPEKFRLHALPRRQRRGALQRGEGARLQQILALAAAPQGEYRGRLPAVPRQGNRHRDGRPRSTTGREIFRLRGCMGCHRYEGFDREADEISVGEPADPPARPAEGRMGARDRLQHDSKADNPRPTTTKRRSSYAHANDLRVRSAASTPRSSSSTCGRRSLVREVKKVGPSLKEVRMKMHKEWIPGVAEGSARVARRHQDAHLPPGR